MNSIIEARNVCMDFAIGDGSIVHALKGINLQIPPNRLSVLRGRSGSGKTTLINILGALDRPTSGEVMFLEDGRDITNRPDKERDRLRRVDMAFVFQSVALISTMTAFENVEFNTFKEQTGYTIGGYLLTKRLFLAKELIAAGTPITEVCYSCGFQNYSTFSRAYKKSFGESPRDYRQSL